MLINISQEHYVSYGSPYRYEGNVLKANRINQVNLKNVSALPADNTSYSAPIHLDAMSLPFPVAILRANDGHVLYANTMMAALLQSKVDDLLGKAIPGLFDTGKHRSLVFKQLKRRTIIPPSTVTLTSAENKPIKVSASLSLTRFDNNLCILVTLQDIPRSPPNLKRLNIVMQRYNMALQAAKVGIWSWDLMTDRIVWDDTMHELFGIEPGTYSGKKRDFLEFMVPEDRKEQIDIGNKLYKEGGKFDTKFRIVRPDGETRVLINRGEAFKNSQGYVFSTVGACWDVTENFALNAKIEHQAQYDPLTGLLNRHEMQRKIEQLLENIRKEPSDNTFCYFDIDRFKVVNDTCGHQAGDTLLSKIAEHLRSYVKKSDYFARVGGDEFAIVITNSTNKEARKVADTIHKAAKDFHFEWNGKVFDTSVSMALVPITADKTLGQILGSADVALSAAKDSGRDRIHEYRPHDSTVIRRHDEMQWVMELEDALRNDRFQLNFQPIQPLHSDEKEGHHYEVLLRVINVSGDVIAPSELLKAAEQFDMATRVDKWVINAMFDWLKKNPDHCKELSLCSINLSGASIGDQEFLTFLEEKLNDDDIPSKKISFEVTENAAIKNINKAADFIRKIKEFGCRFALDDFGSGLSSFAYLKDLPVDILKIDGMFVKGINTEPVNYAMVKAIHDVGKIMKMKTIAEYVENEKVLDKLNEIGVDYGQGYYFGESKKLDKIIVVESEIAEPDDTL